MELPGSRQGDIETMLPEPDLQFASFPRRKKEKQKDEEQIGKLQIKKPSLEKQLVKPAPKKKLEKIGFTTIEHKIQITSEEEPLKHTTEDQPVEAAEEKRPIKTAQEQQPLESLPVDTSPTPTKDAATAVTFTEIHFPPQDTHRLGMNIYMFGDYLKLFYY